MIISAKRRGRGHGGWSKNNPYLQDRYVEYSLDIRPASLVQRLLGVRMQLANEFENDLDIVRIVDGMIMKSYFSRLKEQQQYVVVVDVPQNLLIQFISLSISLLT